MSARKRKRPKDFAARVNAALDRIAATIENGELMLATTTTQPSFFEAVADKLESLGEERDNARAAAVEWRASTCTEAEIADRSNGYAFNGEVTQ